MGKRQISNIRSIHDQIIDYLIANPHVSNNDVAKEFGVTPQWLSTVKHSDAFQEVYQRRYKEVSNRFFLNLHQKVTMLAETAVDILQDRLEADGMVLPSDFVKELAEMALRHSVLGDRGVNGGGKTPSDSQPVSMIQVNGDLRLVLSGARQKIREVYADVGAGVLDGQYTKEQKTQVTNATETKALSPYVPAGSAAPKSVAIRNPFRQED